MTDAISPFMSASNTSSSGATGASATPTLDRNAFLKLLVAQMKNQDPLQPMQGTEFVTQLSQFAQVEQATEQTQQLGVVSTQLTGLSNNEAASLVGKQVTVQGHGVTFDGTSATPTSATLAGPAAAVTVTITDASGQTVRTMQLGAHAAGAVAVNWDGKEDNGQPAPHGTYSVSVGATNAAGGAVSVSQTVTGVVQSVSYATGYAVLTLDSGTSAPISDLISVSAAPTTNPTTTTTGASGTGASGTGAGTTTTSGSNLTAGLNTAAILASLGTH